MLSVQPVLPAWFVLPLALIAALVVGVHLMMLQDRSTPPSRRRIRTVNGLITLLVIPVTAYLFGVVSPAEKREFLLAALASVGLLFIILMLAAIDIFNNLRLHSAERQRQRERLRGIRAELRRVAGESEHTLAVEGSGDRPLRFRADDAGEHYDN